MKTEMAESKSLIPSEVIEKKIFLLRGQKVMLSLHLAELYQVEPKVLTQSVKRNIERFPQDFMFQLTWDEVSRLKSQFVISTAISRKISRSQFVTLKRGLNIKYPPYAFTEQGVAMLSSVLRSKRAVAVNIEIMRAFVRLRKILTSHAELARKLEQLEKKYDSKFRVVFDAIRQLMAPKEVPSKKIGFQLRERRAVYGRGSSLRSRCLSEGQFHAKPQRMQRRLESNKQYAEAEYSRLFAVRAERAGRIK